MNRRQALIATIATPTLATATAQSAAPLTLLRTADIGGWPTLLASAGDHSGRWIVDTGATQHAVDPRWADAARLTDQGTTQLTTITGTRSAPQRALPALRAGGLRWPASTAVELDLRAYEALTGVALAGILGMPLLAARPLVLDFGNGALRPANPDESVDRVPVAIDSGLPVVELALGARPPEPFMLDTGNPGALVIFAHRSAAWQAESGALPTLRVREPGGEIDVAFGLLAKLQLGTRRMEQVPTVLEQGARARRGRHFDRLSGSLGTALFEGGSLLLDTESETLHFRLSGEPLPGGFGFSLRGDHGGPLVLSVVSGSPAARAGILPADRLLAIDGQALTDRRPAAVWSQLRKSTSARTRWQRHGTDREVTLARERFFPALR